MAKTKLEQYEEMQPFVKKEIETVAKKMLDERDSKKEYSAFKIPNHIHNGVDSPRIHLADAVVGYRAAAAFSMASDGVTYKIGLNFNPSKISFTGVAVRSDGMGGLDVRAHVVGFAYLGPSYELTDDGTGSSVTVGGPIRNILQGCSALVVADSGPTFLAPVSEEHIVRVVYPNASTEVARATIRNYNNKEVFVECALATDWTITGSWFIE